MREDSSSGANRGLLSRFSWEGTTFVSMLTGRRAAGRHSARPAGRVASERSRSGRGDGVRARTVSRRQRRVSRRWRRGARHALGETDAAQTQYLRAASAAHLNAGCGLKHLKTKALPGRDIVAMRPQSQSPASSLRKAFGSSRRSSLRNGSRSPTKRYTMAPIDQTSETMRYSSPRITSGAAVDVVPAAFIPVREPSNDWGKTLDSPKSTMVTCQSC